MSPGVWAAIAVHLLTASGAVCGVLALHHASAHEWRAAFLWLGIALIVDAADGPLARRLDVGKVLPRFRGETLDETVDYLNYCVVPAFLLLESGILDGWPGPFAAAVIVITSLFHFADRRSKTADGYFVGFPAIWNVVCFYIFVFGLGKWVTLATVFAFAALTLVPLKWVHPLRVRRLRLVTVAVMACWGLAGLHALASGLPGGGGVKAVFALVALYVVALGLSRTFSNRAEPRD